MAIGAMQDYTYESFTANSRTSQYHLYAAGRTGTGPHGLVVQLHGDGAGEFAQPTGATLALYNNVAKAHNMILLAPRSPDSTGVRTWWENQYSPVWLLALLDHVRSVYNISATKIWFIGFSGGAEVLTYWLMSDYSSRLGMGGSIMLGGGGASGLVFGAQPSATFKTTQRLHWAVGSIDTDDGEGFNAVAASLGGFNRYTTEGFTRTTRELIPGLGHLASEWEGPRILSEQLALAYPAVNPPNAGVDQVVEPWSTVTLQGLGGSATWSQVSGKSVTLAGSGAVRTFVAPAGMTTQELVFAYGTDQMKVTVSPAEHGIINSPTSITPVRIRRVT